MMTATTNHVLANDFQHCQKVLQAMGDENRQYLILALLREDKGNGLRVLELADLTHLSRPAVARHITVLKEAGLVQYHKDGTRGYYRYEPDEEALEILETIASMGSRPVNLPQTTAAYARI